MDKKKILVVDDEDGICQLIKENLELRGGFEVDTASNGRDGLKSAKAIKPDLIILDIRMPKMDGFEVLKRLKDDMSTMAIPVIMLSALEDDASKIKSSQLYSDFYMTKPLKIAELQSKVEQVLKIKGPA